MSQRLKNGGVLLNFPIIFLILRELLRDHKNTILYNVTNIKQI